MKINELINEGKKLQEKSPVGGLQQGWNKLKGALGSTAGKASADVGSRANEIYKNFSNWGLRSGIDMKAAPVTDIQSWFKSQNLIFPQEFANAPSIDLTNKDTSTKFWTSAAQQAFKASQAGKGASLGASYNLPSTQAKAKKAPGTAKSTKQKAQSQQGQLSPSQTYASLATQLQNAKGTLRPNQINALLKILNP
jgi:hypothetical protein